MQSTEGRVAPVRVVPATPARPAGSSLERSERRAWLKTSGVLMGTLAAGSPLALLAPSLSWALPLQSLSESEGKTLLAMGRVLYPHRRLPDAVYALLVKALDELAAADALKRQQLVEGISALDEAAGGRFASAKADIQQQCTKAIEGQPFFELVRSQCITALYDNEMSFSLFGYPGPSWQLGGYLQRGFQDLDWLPTPPAEASPPLVDGKVGVAADEKAPATAHDKGAEANIPDHSLLSPSPSSSSSPESSWQSPLARAYIQDGSGAPMSSAALHRVGG